MAFYHATPAANLSAILAEGLEPRIGARSRMIGEEEPAIYLFDALPLLEDAIGGWLGDAYEEAGIPEVALLEITLSPELEAATAIRHLRSEPIES